MAMTAKQVFILLTRQDEAELQEHIAKRIPEVKFLDFDAWEVAVQPPIRDSVLECGPEVSIWNPLIVPSLPTGQRSDGRIVGPLIGPVIQWHRSRESQTRELQSGRFAASYDGSSSTQMTSFINSVWEVLLSLTDDRLIRVSMYDGRLRSLGAERRFRLGSNARQMASASSLVLLSGKMRLMPER
jgi:hypothetical protein